MDVLLLDILEINRGFLDPVMEDLRGKGAYYRSKGPNGVWSSRRGKKVTALCKHWISTDLDWDTRSLQSP